MNRNRKRSSLRMNQIGPYGSSCSSHGKCQPPKKSVTISAESTIRLMYSAIWKRPQRIPEYSVWYPATSSLSASGRSNGERAVSAMPPMKKMTKPIACGMKNHRVASCFETMCVSCSDWPISTTPRTLNASETSYDTSCAHVLIAPSSEYFDSEAQPPTMKPYTPIEPSANTRISATLTSATSPLMCQPLTSQPGPKGMTANAASAVNAETTGAMMYGRSLAAA